jgi:hypothetical protein
MRDTAVSKAEMLIRAVLTPITDPGPVCVLCVCVCVCGSVRSAIGLACGVYVVVCAVCRVQGVGVGGWGGGGWGG